MKFSLAYFVRFWLKSFFFGVSLLGVFSLALILIYLLRIRFTDRHQLELNEEGLFDSASFCELGPVSLKLISKIRFMRLFGAEFLVMDFNRHQNPVRYKRGIVASLYRLLFGESLWVPLPFFLVSRISLESQLIHLNQLVDPESESGSETEVRAERAIEQDSTPPMLVELDLPQEALEVNRRPRQGLMARVASAEAQDPPLDNSGGQQKVRGKIVEIKRQVRESQLDRQVADAFVEDVTRLPAMAVKNARGLPEGVGNVLLKREGSSYEEISFLFADLVWSFALRRDIGPSDEALLALGVDGRVKLNLRVRVEIGELTPIDIESFLPGTWLSKWPELLKVFAACPELKEKVALDLTRPNLSLSLDETVNLTDAKNRFGIDE